MKTKVLTAVLMMGLLSGCSSSFFLASNTTGEDDVYFNPDKQYVASASGSEINPLNANDPRIAELQRKMNASMSDSTSTSDTIYVEEESENPYDAVLANSFEESRENRLKAQSELGFNYSAYSDALWYASAYDPAFYNVVVYGSHVWVEPRWVTSSWYYPSARWSLGFNYGLGFGFGVGYGAYWPGSGFGYGVYNPYGVGYYGYNDYYYPGYGGYYGHGRPINDGNYHYGRRTSNGNGYETPVNGSANRRNYNNGGSRSRSGDTRTVNSTAPSNRTNDSNGNVYRRRPGNTTPTSNPASTVERRRQGTGTTPVYTRPSTVNKRGGSDYTPVYNRPSGGLRQDYNTNRPASNRNSGSYERRPASSGSNNQSSGSNSNTNTRPASSNSGNNNQSSGSSGSSYSRPASSNSNSSGSSSGSSNTNNSGSSGGTRKR